MPACAELSTESINAHHSMSSDKNSQYDLHCHSFYEIFFFLSGDVHYLIEGKSFTPEPNSLLLICENAFHGVKIHSTVGYERYAIHFLPQLLSPEYQQTLLAPFHTPNIYLPNAETFSIRAYCDSLLSCRDMDKSIRQIAIKSRMEALLSQLYCMSFSQTAIPLERPNNYSVQKIIAYLNEHIAEPISLDFLVSHFYISKNQMNLLFREATGTTVSNYISYKRATLAQQLMVEGQSAGNAALNVGFQDYSTFYRTYQKVFGYSPAELRGRNLLY